jgi:hypothetical protein
MELQELVAIGRRYAAILLIVLVAAITLGGKYVYGQGVEAGRELERKQLRLTCGLAQLGDETPADRIESAQICLDLVL